MRNLSFVLLILLSGACTSCTDDGAPRPPPPWDSWARAPISADLSIGVHPRYQVTHAYNPADTPSYASIHFSMVRNDTGVTAYRDESTTRYRTSLPAGAYCTFHISSGHQVTVTLTDFLSWQSMGVYLQTIDRRQYRHVLGFTLYSHDGFDEVVLMARSLEYR